MTNSCQHHKIRHTGNAEVGYIERNENSKPHMIGCWNSMTIDFQKKYENIAWGSENKDYAYCEYIISIDLEFDNEIITSLNNGLTSIGSICRFNEQGIPVIGTASSGTANGSNFGNGGEF